MLVLDDDEAQREVVTEILQLEGVEVLNATTFSEAACLLDKRPDVALTDLHGVDADKFINLIRSRRDRPRVLLVSGDMKVCAHAERLHVDGWLAKPYDVDDLLNALRTVLSSSDAEHPPNG